MVFQYYRFARSQRLVKLVEFKAWLLSQLFFKLVADINLYRLASSKACLYSLKVSVISRILLILNLISSLHHGLPPLIDLLPVSPHKLIITILLHWDIRGVNNILKHLLGLGHISIRTYEGWSITLIQIPIISFINLITGCGTQLHLEHLELLQLFLPLIVLVLKLGNLYVC